MHLIGDAININICLAVSTISSTPLIAIMSNESRTQLAYAAGAKHVVALQETLGEQLVNWVCAGPTPTEFLKLIDVDVSPDTIKRLKPSIIHIGSSSELIEKSLGEVKIRIVTGATVAAIWNSDGTITTPSAHTALKESSLIVLGPDKNVEKLACFIGGPGSGEHVVLVGAGRVGQQAGKRLNQAGINPHVIDILEKPLSFNGKLIVGDATLPQTLHQARIEEADTLIVTLNSDSLNIFTVLSSRQLNPNLNVIVRAIHADTVDRLCEAGANHVLSEAILGSQLLQVAMVEMGVLPKFSDYVN